jgi:hypothetical protein
MALLGRIWKRSLSLNERKVPWVLIFEICESVDAPTARAGFLTLIMDHTRKLGDIVEISRPDMRFVVHHSCVSMVQTVAASWVPSIKLKWETANGGKAFRLERQCGATNISRKTLHDAIPDSNKLA